MQALLLQRGAAVNRRIARLWRAAGLEVIVTEDPSEVPKHVQDVAFIGADEFDRNVVAKALDDNPALRAVLWTAESVARIVRFVVDRPRVTSILARPSFEATPAPWELLMVARRMIRPHEPPLAVDDLLHFGASGFDQLVATREAMEAALSRAQTFVDNLKVPGWIPETVGELAHELLMNALYDAPVDAEGRQRFAHDRKGAVRLGVGEAPRLRMCTDGVMLCVHVSDPFGRLTRRHVFEGLARGLQEGELDRSGGGAGLGMAVCHNSSLSIVYDVAQGKQTDVTAFLDLEMTRRDFRSRARSVHFFERHV